jgi:S-adenosylmethionine/arginine decarboxylase-like enzyme
MKTTTYRIECGLPFDLSQTRNSPDDPNNRDGIWTHVLTVAARSGLTVLTSISYPFAGGGITGVAILAESSLSLHTWPETNFALVELTTCGARRPTERFVEAIALSSRTAVARVLFSETEED